MSFLVVIRASNREMLFGAWTLNQSSLAQDAADRKGPGLLVATCHIDPLTGPELNNPPFPEPPTKAWALSADGMSITAIDL